MPHVESIGLGGGSIVRVNDESVIVGPDSVGHYLTTKSKVFGGDVLTATDVAVAAAANVTAWLGIPVPEDLQLSILFQAQFFNEQGAVVDQGEPDIVHRLRRFHKNLVS